MRVLLLLGVLLGFLVIPARADAQSGVVTVTVMPNPLKVTVSAPQNVSVRQWFTVSADVSNLGKETITQTVATLNVPAKLKVQHQRRNLGNLAAHGTKTVTWQVKANASGSFIITAEASGKLLTETISSSDSTTISSVGLLGAFLLKLIFDIDV